MNIATVIGAFVALSKETGAAFGFPGSVKTYENVFAEVTDSHAPVCASLLGSSG